MTSMNNWLGFSLSPQEFQDHSQGFNSDEISGAGDSCYDLPPDSSLPSLNLPAPPFSILEAFNRNTPHSQDWNMKDASMNTFACNNQERPKLENFLGVGAHSFADHQENDKISNYHLAGNDNNAYNMYQESPEATSAAAADGVTAANSTIGLSMIKNWLRNNPAPPHAAETNEAPPLPAGGAQTLSLSMSTGSQSTDSKVVEGAIESAATPRKSIDTFGQRTSIYRGVTRHRWTGRYEAHLWDNSCRREGQTRKGRQGGYDKEDKAARAYDLAALKYWGTTTTTNFPISNYEKEIEEMKHMTRQEYVASLRRKSSGFSRGASIYRGVTRHHQHGRWQARIGRVAGNKDLYLGTFSTQEEAAEAYDIAAIKFRGLNAVTNFEINRYDVKSILESSTLPIGGAAKRLKDAENAEMALDIHRANEASLNLHLPDGSVTGYGNGPTHGWPSIAFQQPPHTLAHLTYPYSHQRMWCKQEQDTDISHGFHDINHQLQLGSTQNFLQPNVLHNIMSLDSASMEQSSGVYGDANMVPMMGTVIVQDGNGNSYMGNNHDDHQSMLGAADHSYQQARNYYYQSQQASATGVGKGSVYDQAASGWIPTAVPAPRANNVAACHGAPSFTVWNDT
ncbi:hypothetical protein ACS0TY_005043 [Phlomoides rotata]